MRTDAALIARLAHEIGERFGAARLQDAGLLADERFALVLWKGGSARLLVADVFAPTPLLTVENGALPVEAEPGFVRSAVTALRGKTLHASRSREGERILELEFSSRSRFGVAETYVLIYELVPRYGNIILTKDGTVVAALKEFRASGKALRSIRAGRTYEPPPPRPARAQGGNEPTPDATGSVLDLFAQMRGDNTPVETAPGVRTNALRALNERERKLRAELERVAAQIAAVSQRDELRAQGEAIYAGLHELPPAERAAAKKTAAALFARYKKAAASATHLLRRKTAGDAALADLEELRWELERADEERIREVAALVSKSSQRRAPAVPSRKRKSAPPQFVTQNGSRILVGRSPLENAELTFRIARPGDLWFHARGQPGAHVILQRDDRSEHREDDIRVAAELAAFHSKGRTSSKVAVDYTARKHVRKRPNAAPGLVFYTGASSITVEPRDSMNIASPKEKNR